MNEFYEGQEVAAIFWCSDEIIRVGTGQCDKITVVMEAGQMAAVPWFAVWYKGNIVSKWNAALMEGVEVLPSKRG